MVVRCKVRGDAASPPATTATRLLGRTVIDLRWTLQQAQYVYHRAVRAHLSRRSAGGRRLHHTKQTVATAKRWPRTQHSKDQGGKGMGVSVLARCHPLAPFRPTHLLGRAAQILGRRHKQPSKPRSIRRRLLNLRTRTTWLRLRLPGLGCGLGDGPGRRTCGVDKSTASTTNVWCGQIRGFGFRGFGADATMGLDDNKCNANKFVG